MPLHMCHHQSGRTVQAMTSAAAQRCLPLSPVGPPLSSQSVLSVSSSCQPANKLPVPIQDYLIVALLSPFGIAHL